MRSACLIAIMVLSLGCMSAGPPKETVHARGPCDGESCRTRGSNASASDMCLFNMSQRCSDPRLCDWIIDKELEYRCRASHGEFDTILCSGILNDTVRGECWAKAAEATLDAKLCDRIGGKDQGDECVFNIVRKSGNRSTCDRIGAKGDQRDFCFAIADRDARICGDLAVLEYRTRCVEWISQDRLKAPRQTN
jgi:hypothetical protein